MQLNRSLLPLVLAAAVPSSPAWAAGGGGAAPPPSVTTPDGGGTVVGKRVRRATLEAFSVPVRAYLYGRAPRVRFRLGGRSAARVRLRIAPRGRAAAATTVSLGWRRPGVTHSVALGDVELAAGAYTIRIGGRDRRGRALRRAARASSHAELEVRAHRFPLAGPYGFGGEDARFGAGRDGHSHQGQDLIAAEGTPVVAPRGGTIESVEYQAGGAGNYVVLDGAGEERDYVFMHLRTGSVVVEAGRRVRTGQRLGEVGSTGRSSGPHLHFEVWSGQWYGGGRALDPLPLLRAWAR